MINKDVSSVFISGISFCIGSQYSIEELNGLDDDYIKFYKNIGLNSFRRYEGTIYDLIKEVILKHLDFSNIKPYEIEGLILSFNLDSVIDGGVKDSLIDKIISDLGIKNCSLYFSSLSSCSNLTTSIKLGNSLLQSATHSKILVVLADKICNDSERLMDSGESILSDGALAFNMSNNTGEYQLIELYNSFYFDHVEQKYNILSYSKKAINELRILWELVLKNHDITSFKKVLFCNFNLLFQASFRENLNFNEEQLFTDTLSTFGHVFSSDVFINLKEYEEQHVIEPNTFFACFTMGYFRWGVFVIKKI